MKHPSNRKQVGAASRSRLLGQDVHLVPAIPITATITWLLVYLLQTNCTKDTQNTHDISNTRVRDKGYNLLQALVGIAARFADHGLGPITTSFGSATLEADLTLKGHRQQPQRDHR